MHMNLLLQALLGGAVMRHAPGMIAPYTALRARLLDLCGNDPAFASALLALENHPASTTHQATLEQRLSQLQLRYDTELNTAMQAVLAEAARQEALGEKTTGSPVAGLPDEIVCERCGQPQPATRLVCWSCGREFISQEAAAPLRANAVDAGKTIRLPALPTQPTVAGSAPVVNTEGNMSPELLQTLKKISAEQEAIHKAVESQNGTLRQLVGLQTMAHPVIVQDLRMDFGSMVVFMIKWAIAAIPAFLLLFILLSILMSIFGGIFLSALLR